MATKHEISGMYETLIAGSTACMLGTLGERSLGFMFGSHHYKPSYKSSRSVQVMLAGLLGRMAPFHVLSAVHCSVYWSVLSA